MRRARLAPHRATSSQERSAERRVRDRLSAQVIHRLRELDLPLSDVQRILRSPDPGARAAIVSAHLQRLESELHRTQTAVASLRRLLQPEPEPVEVELRAVPATTVAVVENDVDREPIGAPGGL